MQFDVKIRKVIENGKPLKAVASVTVDGAFVIHNVRVIETENAKFVAMPYATYFLPMSRRSAKRLNNSSQNARIPTQKLKKE